MAVGPTAFDVEGQQTYHQHPQIGQLTPPLYSRQHVLCPKMQNLEHAVGP